MKKPERERNERKKAKRATFEESKEKQCAGKIDRQFLIDYVVNRRRERQQQIEEEQRKQTNEANNNYNHLIELSGFLSLRYFYFC